MPGWLTPLLGPVAVVAIVAILALLLAPMRRRVEPAIMRVTRDHGIKLLVYPEAKDMMGLRPDEMLEMEPSWLTDPDYYFADGVPEGGPATEAGWPKWAREHGGENAGWQHILIRIQATQDRTILLTQPRVNSTRTKVEGGVVLSPAKDMGGNGLMARQFHIQLDESPPIVEYHGEYTPQFKMRRGDSEAYLVIARAAEGRHVWTLDIPVIVDGQEFTLRADNHGKAFVTVGTVDVPSMWWDFELQEWREPRLY